MKKIEKASIKINKTYRSLLEINLKLFWSWKTVYLDGKKFNCEDQT